MVFVTVETPIGNNLQHTYKVMKEVEARVKAVIPEQERRMVALDVGVGQGFVSMFSKGVHAGLIRIPLVPIEEREHSQAELEDLVRHELKKIPGIKSTVALPFDVMGSEGDILVEIRGHNLNTSRELGLDLADKLRAFPEMAEVNFSMEDQKPEVRVTFDRAKMAALGLSTAEVGNAISTYFMGQLAGRYAEGRRRV